MNNYELINLFIKSNTWYKETGFINFQDCLDDHYSMMKLTEEEEGSCIILGGRSRFEIICRGKLFPLSKIKDHCKDVHKPTKREKGVFEILYEFKIPWSEEQPLVL